MNFNGFQRAVNRLGCVYVDIDRRYFNDRGGPGGYATIDIKPGYQKMCGTDSLDYVRYRHTDDDFVRAARQQDFLRQAKDQIGLGKVFGDRNELLKIFGRYTETDIARDNDAAILRLIKLAYDSTKNPIHEVKFRAGIRAIGELRRDLARGPADDARRVHRRRHRRVARGENVRRAAGAKEAQAHQDDARRSRQGPRPAPARRARTRS